MAEISWTPDAEEDLREVHAFIARNSLTAAESLILQLVATVGRLREYPQSGRIVPEFAHDDLRELIFGAYRIVYRVKGATLEIIRVRHGARLLRRSQICWVGFRTLSGYR